MEELLGKLEIALLEMFFGPAIKLFNIFVAHFIGKSTSFSTPKESEKIGI